MALFDLLVNTKNKVKNGLSNALLGQPVQAQATLTPQAENNNAIADYQNYLKQNNYSDDVINGVPQGLNHGNKEVADWINQYNSGIGAKNPINIPKTQEEVQLAKSGLFNKLVAPQETTQQPAGRVGGIVPDAIKGFKDNLYNGYDANNWGENEIDGRKKGFAFRAGEGLGTLARTLNSPFGRGLAIAGLAALAGGSGAEAAGYGLQTMVKNQQNVAADKMYRQSLIDNYGYEPAQLNKIRGYINNDTFKNLVDSRYKSQLNTYRNKKLDQTSYIKMVQELDRLHKAGQLPDDAYLTTLQDLNRQYEGYGTYNIGDVDTSNDTRKTDSQIVLNEAKKGAIENPKPRVNITYRYGNSNVTHTHNSNNGNGSLGGKNAPLGAPTNTGKVLMEKDGRRYLVPAHRVDEYKRDGGVVIK